MVANRLQTKGHLLTPIFIKTKETPSTAQTTIGAPLITKALKLDNLKQLQVESRIKTTQGSRGQQLSAALSSFLADSKRRPLASTADPQQRRLGHPSRKPEIHARTAAHSASPTGGMSSSPKQRQTGTPHPGARPLHSEELDGFWQGDRDKEIINRGDYLVRNHLEVPPHIIKAYYKIKEEGLDWCRASETTICRVIDSLPPRLFESQVWRREDLTEPCRVTDPAYYDIMQRISRSEQEFLSVDRDSASTRLLENIREPASTPHSFKWHLKQAGVSIDRIFNFTNSVCKFMAKADGGREPAEATWPILQFQNQHRRKYLMKDMARYLRSKPNGHSELPHTTFFIPDTEDPHLFLEEGILKINARTLVYDTTHNNNLLKLLQEVDIRPGVIIKQFTFWRDGDDAKTPEGKQPAWRDFYDVPHWLRDNYDVYARHPGSGFVTCNPTIYIRKGKPSLLSRLAP